MTAATARASYFPSEGFLLRTLEWRLSPLADIDGPQKDGQPNDMKRRILFAVAIALLVGILAGWATRGFVASDRCFDRGGAWDGDLDACRL